MALLGTPLPWVRKDAREGLFYTRRWRGRVVISSWPGRRRARRSALQRQKERDFAAAVLAIKWMDPQMVAGYRERLAGTGTLWRDQLMAQLYGTAFAITTADGTVLYPQQFWQKVSAALDWLGAESGALLVRGIGQWQTLQPGPAGARLTSNGPDTPPSWA